MSSEGPPASCRSGALENEAQNCNDAKNDEIPLRIIPDGLNNRLAGFDEKVLHCDAPRG